MNKKQAYELANYLLDEAFGILNYADVTDVKAVPHLLGTAAYITWSYNLKERKEIEHRICALREQTREIINNIERSIDTIF